MAGLFHDVVGFLIYDENVQTGVSKPVAVEKRYYGTVPDPGRRWSPNDHQNDDLTLSNQIKITANDYAFKHMSNIAYVHYMGGYWKVDSIRVQVPNIILNVGGVWNGPTAASG